MLFKNCKFQLSSGVVMVTETETAIFSVKLKWNHGLSQPSSWFGFKRFSFAAYRSIMHELEDTRRGRSRGGAVREPLTRKTKKSWGRSICNGRVCRPPKFAWSPKPVTVPNSRILSTISEAHLTVHYRVMTFSLSIRYVTLWSWHENFWAWKVVGNI